MMMYGDSAYLGSENREEASDDEHLKTIDCRVAMRLQQLEENRSVHRIQLREVH